MSIFYQLLEKSLRIFILPNRQPLGLMLLKDFLPRPENRHLIRLYRIVHFKFPSNHAAAVKAYPPRPEQVLSFFPFEPETIVSKGKKIESVRCAFTGQHDSVFDRFVRNEFLCFQIVFQPSGFYLLTGMHAFETRNQYLHAPDVFNGPFDEVNDRLYCAKSYDDMLAIADNFVSRLRTKKTATPFDQVANCLLTNNGNTSLDWLASQSSLSIKQFERNFKMRTGVTPKTFMRIRRFDNAFRMKNQFPDLDWLSVAINCGYYDYQHLVKDYLDFTSLTPPAFHVVENKAPERTFGLHEGFYDTRLE
jgi:AraC-like DNA-binding protein